MGYSFDFSAVLANSGLLLQGAGLTLSLAVISGVLGIVFGIGGACVLIWGPGWSRRLVAAYVELIRNTPFLVQLFFIFFGLPSLGVKMPAVVAAALAMTINLLAYAIEILRAGIAAVPRGQTEAGIAIGLSPRTIFADIVLPQALAVVYPAIVSQVIITMLESAVVSQIAVTDLTHAADLIQSRTYRAFETYFAITLIYLGMALALRWIMQRAGRRLFLGRA